MKLIIAEKPQLGQAIADALPGHGESKDGVIRKGEYTIVWAYGHLLTLKEPEDFDPKYQEWSLENLPIFFENWGLKVCKDSTKGGKKGGTSHAKAARLKQIGDLLNDAACVIHAGDIDEEGQLLIDEILRWFHYSGPVWRLNTNDTSEGALRKALSHMKNNTECEADGWSAYGRELSDAVFGFNLTRYFTAKNNGVLLPVGRVQTPTLGLVVQRDALIDGHKKIMYYELFADLSLHGKSVQAQFIPNPDNPALTDGRFLNPDFLRSTASRLEGKDLSGLVVKKETFKQQPPLPFNLTKLTSYCSSRWQYNPDEVMKITQSLRENYKAITYNRSDCQYLSEEHFKAAPETVAAVTANLGLQASTFDTSIKSKCFNDANLTAHFAIIPTNEKVDIEKMTVKERNVYLAISHYYLAQFLPPAQKERTTLFTDLGNGESLKATSVIVTSPGYQKLLNESESEQEDRQGEESGSILSGIPAGNYSGRVSHLDIKSKETRPPSHYTQASLLVDMTRIAKYVDDPIIKQMLLDKDKEKEGENGSIGTSATRPFIISQLIARNYLMEKTEGKRTILIATPKGKDFYNILPDEIKKADTTAKWWSIQEDIKVGAATPQQMALDVLATVKKVISSDVGVLSNAAAYANGGTGVSLGRCPQCGGIISENSKAFSCSNKDCKCIFFKNNKLLASVGKKMTASVVKSLITSEKAVLKGCKSAKSTQPFDCMLRVKYGDTYPQLSFDFNDFGEIGKCPLCGGSVVENAHAFACSTEGCKCVFFKENRLLTALGKKLTPSTVKTLLEKGRAPLQKCKSPKSGKIFDCYLVVKYDGQYPSFELDLNVQEQASRELGKCPKCGGKMERNKFGNYSCSNWRDGCKFTINGSIRGKSLTDANIRDLLSKGRTSELHGFQSKSGKKFDAKLVLRSDGKISFDYGSHTNKR